MKTVRARQGDSIGSLAHENGHFWETVWNEGANAELRSQRTSPNQLAPGDEVAIPDLRRKDESGATEQKHRFVRKGVPAKLRIQLKRLGRPRKDEPYVLEVDGELIEGQTDGDGWLEHAISPDAQGGKLLLKNGQEEIPVRIGNLDPVSVISGVQQRLNNLGFSKGSVSKRLDPKTREALQAFQRAHELEPSGEPDDATKAKLAQLYP